MYRLSWIRDLKGNHRRKYIIGYFIIFIGLIMKIKIEKYYITSCSGKSWNFQQFRCITIIE